jgi:hypothetical protein
LYQLMLSTSCYYLMSRIGNDSIDGEQEKKGERKLKKKKTGCLDRTDRK